MKSSIPFFRYSAIFTLICCFTAFIPAVSGATEKKTKPATRVVIAPFSAENEAIWGETAGSLSDMVMVKLSSSNGIELIDRAMIDQILEEISLNMSWLSDSSQKVLSGKMLGSDLTVTGNLFTIGGKPVLEITVVETETGIIRNYKTIPVNLDLIDLFVAEVSYLIRETVRLKQPDDPERKYISIGRFIPQDGNGDNNIGARMRAYLLERYINHPAIGVVSRTHLGLLLQEIELEKFKHVAKKTVDIVRKIEIAPVRIDGYYYFTQRSSKLTFIINVPGKVYRAIPVKALGLTALLDEMGPALDRALEVNTQPVSEQDKVNAEKYRQTGLDRFNLAYPVTHKNRAKELYRFVRIRGPHPEDIIPAISDFKKALEHNPHDYQTMFPLALCYLSKKIDREGEANSLLQRIMIGTNDPDLKMVVQKFLTDFEVRESAFTGLSDDPQLLHIEVMKNLQYSKTWEIPPSPFEMRLPSRFESVRIEAYAILNQAFLKLSCRIPPPPVPCGWFKDGTKGRYMDTKVRREAVGHFRHGKMLANIDYSRNDDDLPTMDTNNIGGDDNKKRLQNIKNAISEFEAALLMQPDYYEAMLFLGFCLKSKQIGESERAKNLFLRVANESKHDALRFIAADELDVAAGMTFEYFFQNQLTSREYFLKKYEARVNKLYASWNNGQPNDTNQLQQALLKNMKACCRLVLSRRLSRYSLDDCARPLVMVEHLSKKDERFIETRRQIINMLFKDYPRAAPLIICVAQPDLKDNYTLLIRVLNDISSGDINPAQPYLFHKQLAIVYAKGLTAPVAGQDIEKIGQYVTNHYPRFGGLSENPQLDLIHALFRYGNLDIGKAYIEKYFPVTVDIEYNAQDLTASPNASWLDKNGVLKKLKKRGYVDNRGATSKFTGLTQDFYKALSPYDDKVMYHIEFILKPSINIRVTPLYKSASQNPEVFVTPALDGSWREGWKFLQGAAKNENTNQSTKTELLMPETMVWEIPGDEEFMDAEGGETPLMAKVFGGYAAVQETIPAAKFTALSRTGIIKLAMDDQWAAAGVPVGTTFMKTGAVFMFLRNGAVWEKRGKIAGYQRDSHFGAAVDLADGLLIVGSPLTKINTPYSLSEFKDIQFEDLVNVDALLDLFYQKGYIDRYNRVSEKFLSIDAEMKKNNYDPAKIPLSLKTDFLQLRDTDLIKAWKALRDGKSREKTGAAYIFRLTDDKFIKEEGLLPNYSKNNMQFGEKVAIYGDHAAVAARGHSDPYNFPNTGKVFFFQRTDKGWKQSNSFTHNCTAIDMNDSFAVFGGGGKAFIYKLEGNNWIQNKEIIANNELNKIDVIIDRRFREPAVRYFGNEVAISGDFIFIGANGGATLVYKLENNNWRLHSSIADDFFCKNSLYYGCGSSATTLAVSGDTLIIGDSDHERRQRMPDGSNTSLRDAGVAYLFELANDKWTLKKAISPPFDLKQQEWFGRSLAINGGNILASSYSGNIYFFRKKNDPKFSPKLCDPPKKQKKKPDTTPKATGKTKEKNQSPPLKTYVYNGMIFIGIMLLLGFIIKYRRSG